MIGILEYLTIYEDQSFCCTVPCPWDLALGLWPAVTWLCCCGSKSHFLGPESGLWPAIPEGLRLPLCPVISGFVLLLRTMPPLLGPSHCMSPKTQTSVLWVTCTCPQRRHQHRHCSKDTCASGPRNHGSSTCPWTQDPSYAAILSANSCHSECQTYAKGDFLS